MLLAAITIISSSGIRQTPVYIQAVDQETLDKGVDEKLSVAMNNSTKQVEIVYGTLSEPVLWTKEWVTDSPVNLTEATKTPAVEV